MSKQFLNILGDMKERFKSIVKRVWDQLISAKLGNSTVVIATSNSQVEILQSQLGTDIPIVLKAERRDTFPAIVLATSYLYSV